MKKVSFGEFNRFMLDYEFYSQLDEEEVNLTFYNKKNNRELGKIFSNGDCYIWKS